MIINKNELNKNVIYIEIITIFIIFLLALFSIFKIDEPMILEEELQENGVVNYNKLVINEYMSSDSTVVDINGNNYEWIELYNGNDYDINLKNYGLSDDSNKVKWVFPDSLIKAKSYLIIYLSKTTQEGLYATFNLKSTGGETIALIKPSGKIHDLVKTVALDSNESAARNLNGNWIITDTPTPGYANTKEGYNDFINEKYTESSQIKINEILPKNSGNFVINNKFYGYVEIINEGTEKINLNNYYLSNDINKLYKYKLDEIELDPNEVVVIYMGNGDSDKYFSGFTLDSKNGTVYLSNTYGIVDSITYEELPNGLALVKTENIYKETSIISPGYLNDLDGVQKFQQEYQSKKADLIINEVMNKNNSYLAQNGYNFYDWIELYNNSNREINLSSYALSTSSNNKNMYKLPNITIKPNEYIVFMASGDINLTNKTYYHTNFKLSDVESIYLYNDSNVVDSVVISDIPLNYSYGRTDNSWQYLEKPTPLKANNLGKLEVSYAPVFSSNGGVYNNISDLEVEIASIGPVYYTLDGSTPTTKSNKYTGPIKLTKTSVVKAITLENNKAKSDVVTASYIINENHTLPVISMSLNRSDYNKIVKNNESTIEVAGYLEFYEDSGSFKIPCSISLFGGQARFIPKKSYGIRFKSEYGANNLVYNLFDNRDTSVYESLVIRSGSQDYEKAYFRDLLGTSLADEYTSLDTQSYKNAVLYINGEYYGLYNLREKVNDDFIANHYNVDPDKLNLIQGNGQIKDGTRDFYKDVVKYVNSHNMALESSYEGVKELMDMENYIDFMIAELYAANVDIINIRYFSHPDIDNGKLKMILFDLDFGYREFDKNYYYFLTNPAGMNTKFHVDNTIFIKLLKNNQFKKDFLERLSYNLKNTWSKKNLLDRYDELYNSLCDEMKREQKRWNLNYNNWLAECKKLREFIEKREGYLLSHTKSYFKLSNEEYDYYFGGIV